MNTLQSNNPPTSVPQSQTPLVAQGQRLKIGIDVHAAFLMVAWQIDGSNPKPPQKFTLREFWTWIDKQQARFAQIVSCYETGPTGFWLHRQLTTRGVVNYVVCATRLDSRGKGVNTDKTDTRELLSRLDRYVAGNRHAFSPVRVPTEAEEQRRTHTRQREQLRRHRLSLAAQGRSLMLLHGQRQSNQWWQPARWNQLRKQLPVWMVAELEIYHRLIAACNQELSALDKQIQSRAPAALPNGFGRLTHEVIDGEVAAWDRFKNRRQVGGYAGLTGGVSGSGEQTADLSITKAGNARLRTALIELAWRLVFYQPDYWLVQKWSGVLLNPKAHTRRRKQVIVAFSRQLLVDLWKWKTGRVTPEHLGWVMRKT